MLQPILGITNVWGTAIERNSKSRRMLEPRRRQMERTRVFFAGLMPIPHKTVLFDRP